MPLYRRKTYKAKRFTRVAYAPCVECGGNGKPVRGEVIYSPNRPDLWDKTFYLCPCGAYVSSHRISNLPKGYPGGTGTRRARIEAHAAFDPLWQQGVFPSRDDAYQWLAAAMGIAPMLCHIGKLNAPQAKRVTRLSFDYWERHANEEQQAARQKEAVKIAKARQARQRAEAKASTQPGDTAGEETS